MRGGSAGLALRVSGTTIRSQTEVLSERSAQPTGLHEYPNDSADVRAALRMDAFASRLVLERVPSLETISDVRIRELSIP